MCVFLGRETPLFFFIKRQHWSPRRREKQQQHQSLLLPSCVVLRAFWTYFSIYILRPALEALIFLKCESPPMHFPFSIEFPPIGTDPDLVTSPPTYLLPCGPFLQPWLYRSFSARLQLNTSENCSTCRAEIHVFLLHCFDPKPIYIF